MNDHTSRLDQAENATLSSAQPYDMESIQIGALRAVIRNRDAVILEQEAQIVALMMENEALQVENERLRESVGALEVESVESETAVVFDELTLPVHCYG